MARIGYVRETDGGPPIKAQLAVLRANGCGKIFFEARKGGRRELGNILDCAAAGDVLVVASLDRVAGSLSELAGVLARFQDRKVALVALGEAGLDTSGEAGEAVLQAVRSLAAFEQASKRDRKAEVVARTKRAGAYRGRPATIPVEAVRTLKAQGKGATEIARELNIGRASVYRLLAGGDRVSG